jgi:hypothetical protein
VPRVCLLSPPRSSLLSSSSTARKMMISGMYLRSCAPSEGLVVQSQFYVYIPDHLCLLDLCCIPKLLIQFHNPLGWCNQGCVHGSYHLLRASQLKHRSAYHVGQRHAQSTIQRQVGMPAISCMSEPRASPDTAWCLLTKQQNFGRSCPTVYMASSRALAVTHAT